MATAKKNVRKAAPKKAASKRAAKRGTATRRKTQKHGSSEDTPNGESKSLFVTIRPDGGQEVLELTKGESDNVLFYVANNRGYVTRPVHEDAVMRVQPEHANNPLVKERNAIMQDRVTNGAKLSMSDTQLKGKPSTTLESRLAHHYANAQRFRQLLFKAHSFTQKVNGTDGEADLGGIPEATGNRLTDYDNLNVHSDTMLDKLEKFIAYLDETF